MIQLNKFNNSSFDRGVTKVVELAWVVARSLFFMHSIPVPSIVKVIVLRIFGAQVGSGVVIRSRVNICMPWRIVMGDYTWIGDDVYILSLGEVLIGSHCCVSQRAFLCTGSHDFNSQSFDLVVSPIVIEEGCWIGALSFVGPGVIMKKGSRSLAGSVVVSTVRSGAVVAGVPAKEMLEQFGRDKCLDATGNPD